MFNTLSSCPRQIRLLLSKTIAESGCLHCVLLGSTEKFFSLLHILLPEDGEGIPLTLFLTPKRKQNPKIEELLDNEGGKILR